jgi:hypothetical protein
MSLPPPQPSYPPQYPQSPGMPPAYPPQPGFPAPAPYPAGAAAPYPAGFPPAPARAATAPSSRRPSIPQVIGAQVTLWALALILFIAVWRPMEKWVVDGFDGNGGTSVATRIRLSDWVLYALPFLVGGIAAAAFLRPGIARVAIAGAIAVVVPLATEFGLIALFDHLDVSHLSIYYLAYALTATAFGIAWLVLRGRSPARVLIGLAVLPLNWLLLLGHNKLIQVEGVRKLLHLNFDYGLLSGLLLFFFTAASLAIPTWLAAIGQPARAPRPPSGPYAPTSAGWPAQSVAGYPSPAAPAWAPGQPPPAQPGWPNPGQPAPQSGWPPPGQPASGQPGWPTPAQPAPGQAGWPTPGQPTPGQPVPGQPAPGQPAPGQSGWAAPGQPGQGGWPVAPLDPPAHT